MTVIKWPAVAGGGGITKYPTLASFPASAAVGDLGIAEDTLFIYVWNGSSWVLIDAEPTGTAGGELSGTYPNPDVVASVTTTNDSIVRRGVTGNVQANTFNASGLTASTVPYLDASKDMASSAVTDTELGYLSGVSSGVQTQIDSKVFYSDMLVSNIKYVSKNGNDSTGDGSFSKPYLTIGAALTGITDASPTKRYVVLVQSGTYTENISLKANIFIQGTSQETVRLDGTVNFHSSMSGGADNRTGCSSCIIIGAVDLNWATVTSAAGKIYFKNCSFNSTVNLYGYNNATAQGQFWNSQFFDTFTNSGINLAIHANNIHYGNITLTQHPVGGMASVLIASGGSVTGTVSIITTVSDFGRRSSLFAYNFFMTGLTIDGPSSYADVTQSSIPAAGPTILNGGNIVYVNQASANQSLSNLNFPTAVNQPIMPATTNATNFGDWDKQWFWSFGYVHASTGTDCYLISYGPSYGADTAGRNVGIYADGAGLATDTNGGSIALGTAAVSGTGVRGNISLDGREVDVNNTKIVNLADGTNSSDAVNKSQLDTKEPTITTLAASKGGLGTDASAFTGVTVASSGVFSATTIPTVDAVEGSQLAATPSNPSAGLMRLYFKNDQKLYKLDPSGTETEIGAGGGGGGLITSVVAINSNTTLTDKALHLVDTTAARSLTLPAAASLASVVVKDASGSASTNNITVSPASGTIDGAASYVVNAAYESVQMVSDGTNWFVI